MLRIASSVRGLSTLYLIHYSNGAQIQEMEELLFCSYEEDDPNQIVENDISCLVYTLLLWNVRQNFRTVLSVLFFNESACQHSPCITLVGLDHKVTVILLDHCSCWLQVNSYLCVGCRRRYQQNVKFPKFPFKDRIHSFEMDMV